MAGNGQQHAAAKQEDDDARSNASSDYDQPHGFKERMEYRYRSAMRWIDRNRVLTDFIAYFSFLLVFTIVAIEANPGEDLIEQVISLLADLVAACWQQKSSCNPYSTIQSPAR